MKAKYLLGIPVILLAGCCFLVLVCGLVGNILQSAGILPLYTPRLVGLIPSPVSTRQAAGAPGATPGTKPQKTDSPVIASTLEPKPANTSEPILGLDACTLENSLVWHATSEMFIHALQVNLAAMTSPEADRYAIMESARSLSAESSNIPHPSCLDQLDENQQGALWNFFYAAEAWQEGDQSTVDESLHWLHFSLQGFNLEHNRLSEQYGWSESLVDSWKGVKIGMPSDEVLKLQLDEAESEKLADSPFGMILRWSYPEADLVLMNWEQEGVTCCRVRLIVLH